MRYLMQQAAISLTDNFYIKDENDKDVFFVKGKAFTVGSKLSFQDLEGNELAYIEQKMALEPTYEIYRNDNLYATVKKSLFTLLKCHFKIDVPDAGDLEAEGKFLNHEYILYSGKEEIATISKEWFASSDTYGVDIKPDQDDVLILACAVVIDMICHSENTGM